MKRAPLTLIALLCLTFATVASATNYDEGVNGDLSNDRNNPTSIPLTAGSNMVTATSMSGDREYWTVNVPSGYQLSAVNLVSWTSVDTLGFIALQNGTAFTEPPTGTNIGNLLGYSHFGPGNGTVGTDILDDIGMGPGSQMFTPPLPSGDYAVWSQQTSSNPATYVLELQVTAVTPVPALSRGALIFVCAGLGLMLLVGYRRLFAPGA